MSYWVYLNGEDGEPVGVARHSEGGVYVVGGATEACINITYNYGSLIREHLHEEGLRWIDGQKASDCAEQLRLAVAKLAVAMIGTERDSDYWAATPRNVYCALNVLLLWADTNPDAVFKVS